MKRMGMKSFSDTLSPMGWLVSILGFTPSLLVLFRPSLKELLAYLAAEYAGLILVRSFDAKLFPRVFPDGPKDFFTDDMKTLEKLSFKEKFQYVTYMLHFPKRRAIYCVILSAVKIFLPVAVIVFYWEHDRGNWHQFLMVMWVSLIGTAYLYGAIFLENHAYASEKLAAIHKTYNWAEVFRHAKLPYSARGFSEQITVAIGAIWALMLSLQWFIIFNEWSHGTIYVATTNFLLGLSSLILVSRLLYLSKENFQGGLESLFSALDSFRPEIFQATLPLHSSPMLARFEMIFNSMMERLRAYEQELSQWIFTTTEESRYRALGEISALIVHDLSGPLHVIQFCSQHLKENPDKPLDARYVEQLTSSNTRALELVSSLRAYLKGTKPKEIGTLAGDSLQSALRLLESRFLIGNFKAITFEIDDRISPFRLNIDRTDLIHIFINLLANSVANLLDNAVRDPKITFSLADVAAEDVTFRIEDNGTGLTKDSFDQLTAFMYLSNNAPPSREGLGLKLIRRLIERKGGSLWVEDVPENTKGTVFFLRLKSFHGIPEVLGNEQAGNDEH